MIIIFNINNNSNNNNKNNITVICMSVDLKL